MILHIIAKGYGLVTLSPRLCVMSFASHGDGQRPVKPSVGDNFEAKEFGSALKIHLDPGALLIDA